MTAVLSKREPNLISSQIITNKTAPIIFDCSAVNAGIKKESAQVPKIDSKRLLKIINNSFFKNFIIDVSFVRKIVFMNIRVFIKNARYFCGKRDYFGGLFNFFNIYEI